jgi:hypothetical protein
VATSPVSVAVFYDWQNVYKTAREAFGWTNMPNEYGNFSRTSWPGSWLPWHPSQRLVSSATT